MLNRRTFLGSAVAANAAIAGAAVFGAQQEKPTDNRPHYRAKQVIGAKVTIDQDQSVGTVDDIVFDSDGNVDYLIVMNQDNKLVSIPWDAARFNPEKRLATVHITEDKFQQVPKFAPNQYPAWTVPYRTQTYQYFGLTPHQQRRLIRRGGVVVQ